MTEKIAQLIVRVCTGSRVSIDAYDAATFRKTHGVGEDSWKRVLNSIKLLVGARADAKMSKEDFMIGVGYLTDEQTKAGMLKATELAKSLNVDYIQFRPFHYRASSIDEELKACRALEDPPRFRVIASFQKYDLADSSTRKPVACHGSMFYTVIDARGDCYICCHHVARKEAKIGSLTEMSWQEIIASERRKKLVKAFPTKYCIPECRLSPHNAFLQEILENNEIPPSTASEEIRRHSGFL
jgi:radical SAM protein with 4Fe4S-binding SPASM domain